MPRLPRFIHLDAESVRSHRSKLEIVAPGLSTAHFRLFSDDVSNVDQLIRASNGPISDRATQAAHALATAERSYQLFSEAIGFEPVFTFRQNRVWIYPHYTPVGQLGQTGSSIGLYAGGDLYFDYVDSGPSACAYHDIVVHEVAHAMLEMTHGWGPSSDVETRAVSESLGDVLAFLSAGHWADVRGRAIEETGGDFEASSNLLSRFSEIPGFRPAVRDAAQQRRFDEEPPDAGAHERATSLTSLIYLAFSRFLAERFGRPTHNQLFEGILAISRTVFDAINLLPPTPVTRAKVAAALNAAATDPAMRAAVASATADHGLHFDDSHRSLLAEAAGRPGPESVLEATAAGCKRSESGGPLRILAIRRICARKRKRFPHTARTVIHFECLEKDKVTTVGCLTLGRDGVPVHLSFV